MNFLNPLAFILLILLPIIVLMYLLKLRRPQKVVSSTYLWQQLIRDIEANAPWQKLQKNILMFLQLLFLIAVIFALSNPFLWSSGTGSSSMIIVIDTSASMSAIDVKPSRIEAAKQQAQDLVDRSPDNTRITVISAGEKTEILVSATQDRKQAQQAINAISSTFGESDLSSALQITSAITSRQPETDIIVLSDGNVKLPERISIRGNVFYYPIGVNDDNQGITNIQLQQNVSGDNNTLFVQVENFGSKTVTRRLNIYADEVLYDATDLEIKPNSKAIYLREGLPFETKVIHAELDLGDYYPRDDTAWTTNSNLKPVDIILVTEGNRFLETALKLLPNISLTSISPLGFQDLTNIDADLVVFDGYVPQKEKMPSSSILFISPPESTDYFELEGTIDQPQPRPASGDNQLLKNISFDGISIWKAEKINLPTWATISLSGDYDGSSTPLLFFGNAEGQRVAVVGFRIQDTDLPLQVAFPLLMANLVNWLAPNTGKPSFETQTSLSSQNISIPLDVTQTSILTPEGKTIQIMPDQPGVIILDTIQPGIYSIGWEDNEPILFAVNHFSDSESYISPKQELNLPTNNTKSEGSLQQSRQLFWRPIAFIALIIVVTEWLIYNRGTIIKISNKLLKREIS